MTMTRTDPGPDPVRRIALTDVEQAQGIVDRLERDLAQARRDRARLMYQAHRKGVQPGAIAAAAKMSRQRVWRIIDDAIRGSDDLTR